MPSSETPNEPQDWLRDHVNQWVYDIDLQDDRTLGEEKSQQEPKLEGMVWFVTILLSSGAFDYKTGCRTSDLRDEFNSGPADESSDLGRVDIELSSNGETHRRWLRELVDADVLCVDGEGHYRYWISPAFCDELRRADDVPAETQTVLDEAATADEQTTVTVRGTEFRSGLVTARSWTDRFERLAVWTSLLVLGSLILARSVAEFISGPVAVIFVGILSFVGSGFLAAHLAAVGFYFFWDLGIVERFRIIRHWVHQRTGDRWPKDKIDPLGSSRTEETTS